MKTLAIRIGYYNTTLLELDNRGRNLNITKVSNINCGKNFMIGRYNRIDEYAERLSCRIKAEFKGSMNDAILIIPSDMCIDTLVDAIDIESKNKMKEIKQTVLAERHVGLPGINIIRVGHNTYNDIYLVTEYDSKRLEALLDALYTKGISFKQVVSPMYASHHLTRTVTCPFEVINKGNSSSIVKAGTVIINISINRITYIFTHNNLPIEIRESSHTLMGFIEKMGKLGVPFTKVTRILRLIGVEGMGEGEYGEAGIDTDDFQPLDSLDSLDEIEAAEVVADNIEDEDKSNYVIDDEELISNNKQKTSKSKRSIRELNKDIIEADKTEDYDIYLDDEQYRVFEQSLTEELLTIKAETQKTLNYFSTTHGVKIANIIVTTNDINGIGYKLEQSLDIGRGTLLMDENTSLEIDDYTIYNMSKQRVDCECALCLGAILSNFVRGDIYE